MDKNVKAILDKLPNRIQSQIKYFKREYKKANGTTKLAYAYAFNGYLAGLEDANLVTYGDRMTLNNNLAN